MKYGIEKKVSYYIINVNYKQKEKNEEKIKILDKNFIIKNRNNCKIIYKNKIYDLKEYFEDIDVNNKNENVIKCKILFIHKIIDMSYMFYSCSSLISLSVNNETNINISNFKINITTMKYMFKGCDSLISLPDISKWNISNVIDLEHMFCECNSILKLTDFYILNIYINNNLFELTYKINKNKKSKTRILGNKYITKNKDKGGILYNKHEFELKEFFEEIDNNNNNKDIIKILLYLNKTCNDISYLFYECDSLISVKNSLVSEYYTIDNQSYENYEEFNSICNKSNVDLSNKNDKNNSNNSFNLYQDLTQSSLKKLENKTTNFFSADKTIQSCFPLFELTDISFIFYGCKSLTSLPDISNWNISNINNMSHLFCECKSLISLPDISNWNTSKVSDMNNIFGECNSLISLPDISKWNTSNVKKMEYMFYRCNQLIALPDISKWNTKNVEYMSNLFDGCNSLMSLPNISEYF